MNRSEAKRRDAEGRTRRKPASETLTDAQDVSRGSNSSVNPRWFTREGPRRRRTVRVTQPLLRAPLGNSSRFSRRASNRVARAQPFFRCVCLRVRFTSPSFLLLNPVEIKLILMRSGLIRAGPRGSSPMTRRSIDRSFVQVAKASRRRDAVVDRRSQSQVSPPSGALLSESVGAVLSLRSVHSSTLSAAVTLLAQPVAVTEALRLLPWSPWYTRSGSALTLRYTYYSRRPGHVTHRSVYVTQVVKQVSPSQSGCTGCPRCIFLGRLWTPV